MSTHAEIRIPFTVDGRNFEAVGFLREGEPSVSGDEMLRRVPDAIGEEDAKFLDERYGQDWSRDLWPYWLATAWRGPAYPRYVRFFDRYGGGWDRCWSYLDDQWHVCVLVVRRCA